MTFSSFTKTSLRMAGEVAGIAAALLDAASHRLRHAGSDERATGGESSVHIEVDGGNAPAEVPVRATGRFAREAETTPAPPPAPRPNRISNPKAARKVRQRQKAAAEAKGAPKSG